MHWSELVFNIIFLISILVISRIMYVRRETKYGAIVEVFLNQNYQGLKEKTLKLWIEYDMCTLIPISEAAIEKYNSLCFILAILALSDKNDQEFLNKINAMKRDEKSEVKTFILAIYYYA